MSTVQTWQIESTNSDFTEQLAEKIGASLKGGEVIELVSDLGGGKTTFTRGLVRGLGSTDKVASPTFTISKMYDAGDLEVHHFDFYRLHEAGIIADELAEVAGDPRTVVVVEWADVVQHVLPDQRITIVIKQTPEGARQLTLTYPLELAYAVEAAKA
ncbi:MAG TPA: tRNA (adenosine(37)-N6)-threonylcarbamoyltransferase complex ATPase subunit type 1 TsaE [Candidatus Saccharimonadales bacterium]|nr:tRNA (adenosine(37)-N6)-threonylcarbamoyltransferase complex ATPase subunit type 1 TsaE [Candidatus Saccharimonadales bacterium]